MTPRQLLGLMLFAGAACAADSISLNVRPGTWETSMTTQMTGLPALPPEVLAKMTPEQKAMMESRLKARESQGPKTTVRKKCIRKEDLNKPLNFTNVSSSCKEDVTGSSTSKQEVHFECNASGMKSVGTVRIETIDPEHVKVSAEINSGEGPHAMKVTTSGTAKWLAEGCTTDSGK